jgi:ABC-type bacteriocin/lantibiotic exporter with double-glycine peptidase domain
MRRPSHRALALAGLGGLLAAGCAGVFEVAGPAARAGDPSWWVAPQVELVRQQDRWDCGPAALAMVLGRWQTAAAASEVRQVFEPGHGDGVRAGELRTVARALRLQAFLVRGTMDDLAYELERGRPVLVGLTNYRGKRRVGHYGVVVGVRRDRTRVLLADPSRGWRELALPAFELEWGPASHLAMVVFPARAGATASVAKE